MAKASAAKSDYGTPDNEVRHDAAEAAAHLDASAALIGGSDPALVAFSAAFHPVVRETRAPSGARAKSGTEVLGSFIVLSLDSVIDDDSAKAVRQGLANVFDTVRVVVKDWQPMLAQNLAFLGSLADNHFTFLGCRDYVFRGDREGRLDAVYPSGLGVLTDPEARVVRRGSDRSSLTPELREFLTQPSPLVITKSSFRSVVHRRAHMDYVGVKKFDADGNLIGERRFIGLFTSTAYSQLPTEIPLLRRKTANVVAGSGLPEASHDGK